METIKGLGAGAGVATGVVRIVRTAEDAGSFQRGDVLATEMTSPDMLELMMKSAGFITQHGGRTCHAAVVARQMGKPCVVGLGDGFLRVRDGGFVSFDASTGVVTLLD